MRRFRSGILVIIILLICSLLGCQVSTKKNAPEEGKTKLEAGQITKVTLDSKALNKEMELNVYLPKGYGDHEKYPVLYMIHGYTGDEDTWMPGLKLDKKAEELIEANKIRPMIIVTPDIENSYGVNTSKQYRQLGGQDRNFNMSEGLFEDYLIKDVIPFIDANYSTLASKEGRFIGGMSMGGFAALHLAFSYPDMFSKVGGHSPALFLDYVPAYLNDLLYPSESKRRERDPIYIAQDKDLSSLKVYLDCGDKDELKFYEGCDKLFEILQDKGVASEYHLNPGGHTGAYWEANEEQYLLFYAGI